jgi:hypothetical protein
MPTPIDAMSSSTTTSPIMKRRIGETRPLIDWKNGLRPFFGHDSVDRRQKAWFLPAAPAEAGRMRKSDGLLVLWPKVTSGL